MPKLEKNMNNKFCLRKLLIILIISILVSFILSHEFHFVECYLKQHRVFHENLKDSQIVLVLIDDNTIKEYGAFPFKRIEYAKVISKILRGNPKVIGVDIFFSDIKSKEEDMQLIEVISKARTDIILAVYPNEVDKFIFNNVNQSYAVSNSKQPILGNVVQVIILNECSELSKISVLPWRLNDGTEFLPFPLLIACSYLDAKYKQDFLSDQSMIVDLGIVKIPTFRGESIETYMPVNFIGAANSFKVVPFEKVKEVDERSFKDKIVLIGTSAYAIGDNYHSPVSCDTPGVVIHANAIHTIINNRFVSNVSSYWSVIISVCVCVVILVSYCLYGTRACLVTCLVILFANKIIVDFISIKYFINFQLSPVIISAVIFCLGICIEHKSVQRW